MSKFSSLFYTAPSQIDSIDVCEKHIVLSSSNLEGNVWDGSLRILNASGEEQKSITTQCGASTVRYLNSGMQILAGRDDGNLILYSQSLDEIRKFSAHDDIVSSISTSPINYSQFASVGWDGCLCVFDWRAVDSNAPIYTAEAHFGIIYDIMYNPDRCDQIATVGKDGFARIWDTRQTGGECSHLFEIGQAATAVSWSSGPAPNVLVGREDGQLQVLDLRQTRSPLLLTPHKGSIRRLCVSEHKEGARLVCTSEDTTVTALDCASVTSSPYPLNFDGTSQTHSSSQGHGPTSCASSETSLAPRHEMYRLSGHTDYVTDAVWISGTSSSGGCRGEDDEAEGEAEGVRVDAALVPICEDFLLTCSWDKTVMKHQVSFNTKE